MRVSSNLLRRFLVWNKQLSMFSVITMTRALVKVQDYQADVDLYHELINNLNLTALLSSYELS